MNIHNAGDVNPPNAPYTPRGARHPSPRGHYGARAAELTLRRTAPLRLARFFTRRAQHHRTANYGARAAALRIRRTAPLRLASVLLRLRGLPSPGPPLGGVCAAHIPLRSMSPPDSTT